MSDGDGTCEYVLDPDDPETWGGEEGDECYVQEAPFHDNGIWACPHDAEKDEDLCLFHLPVEKKDDEEVVSKFLDILNEIVTSDKPQTKNRKKQFLGAKFGVFDLDGRTIPAHPNHLGVFLGHSRFSGKVNWNGTTIPIVGMGGVVFEQDVTFETTFENGAVFNGASFQNLVNFRNVRFGERVGFNNAVFEDIADFSDTKFGGLTAFENATFNTDVDFDNVTFERDTSFSDSHFKSNTTMRKAQFEADVEFDAVTFDDDTWFSGSRFEGNVDFDDTIFGGLTAFTDEPLLEEKVPSNVRAQVEDGDWNDLKAEFNNDVNFDYSDFKKGVWFPGIQFENRVGFNYTDFEGIVVFDHATFNSTAGFYDAVFAEPVGFRGATFKDSVDFAEATFQDLARFTDFTVDAEPWGRDGEVPSRATKKEDDSIQLLESMFQGETYFTNISAEELVDFRVSDEYENIGIEAPKFASVTDFDGASLTNGDFSGVAFGGETAFTNADLTDAILTDATLHNVDFENIRLSRATLFNADLRGARLSGAVLGDVRIDEDTRFLGHPSGDSNSSPHTLSAICSRPTCVYDPDYEEDNEHADVDKAKSVYRALEELGGKHARLRLQARAFVRRQDLQKQDYWDDATAGDASLEERIIAGARWSRARVARATLLYGESPWRVIGWSLGIILSFALLYPLGGWMKPADGDPITYTQIASNPVEILNSVYYSTLTYTALGFGDFRPVGLGRLLTTVETGLGAVMLAILVFILGRRAAR
jgi:uncharacterized protein YjbI with pentapeptide repeats